MKRVLIISPYFAPTNAADMQRIRMSLPYLNTFGWEAEVVAVDLAWSDLLIDPLLTKSISPEIAIHRVKAFSKRFTATFGLGSIALRSMWFYFWKVNALLKQKEYNLIYFSTTQFPVCILGAYWKRRFDIPYVIDMQDPWHSDYYKNKPKFERPPKYWFAYRLNKWLEPLAMKKVGGIISVSQAYIDDIKKRYLAILEIPEAVIPFGAFEKDMEIAEHNTDKLKSYVKPTAGKINMVYVGRGGHDMHVSTKLLFLALLKGLSLEPDLFQQFHLYFIGTSYAATSGRKSIEPLAKEMGLKKQVTEITERIGFYDTFATLKNADIVFIPGSDDPKYTASKLFPYLMSQKPILAIFHEMSSAVNIIRSSSPGSKVITFPGDHENLVEVTFNQLYKWSKGDTKILPIDRLEFDKYSALAMTAKQTELFEMVVKNKAGISHHSLEFI